MRLLRLLYKRPGMTVTEMANELGIGVSDTSQELRRIQSRGFLRADRLGVFVYYHLQADPQVPSAAPLIGAVTLTLKMVPPEHDDKILTTAFGLAHPRRIAILRELLNGPQKCSSLAYHLGWQAYTLNHHLRIMGKAGFTLREQAKVIANRPALPLAVALIKLVQQQPN